MAGFMMPYIVPLFLGMTFDARYSRPGVSIYDDQYVDNPLVVEYRKAESTYRVVTDMAELLKTLDISGDLSLKIKSGMIDVQGSGSYLKNEKDLENSIVILTTFKYAAVVKTLSSDAKPRDGWAKAFNPGVLGTHYVSAVTYGVEMVASAKFVVHNSSDVKNIKGEVQAALGTSGDGASLAAEGKLDMLEKRVKDKANLEISYFGTLPIKSIPNTIEGLKELISTFDQQVKDAGLEDGIPVSVLLTPLVDIADAEDKDKFEFIKNEALMTDLHDFEENFNELSSARSRLINWGRTLPFDLKDEYKNEIGKLLKQITDVLDVFYKVLWKMDLTKGAEQLKEAFEAYGLEEYYKYERLVNKLKKKIDKEVDKDAYVPSDTYIHWGNNTCKGEKTVLLHDGFTISSTEDGIGGVAQYDCMPRKVGVKYEVRKDDPRSLLAGIRYAELDKDSNPFEGSYAKQISGKGVPCAKCYSPDSASITLFPAADSCPLTWELKYKGYLMSARRGSGHTTEYICVDDTPTEPYAMDSGNILALTTVHSSGALPDKIYTEGALLRCVVCALKSGNVL